MSHSAANHASERADSKKNTYRGASDVESKRPRSDKAVARAAIISLANGGHFSFSSACGAEVFSGAESRAGV